MNPAPAAASSLRGHPADPALGWRVRLVHRAGPWCECDLQGGKSSTVVTCRVNRSLVCWGGGRSAERPGGPSAQPIRWPSHPRPFPLFCVAKWQLLGVTGTFQCEQKTFPSVLPVNWELTAVAFCTFQPPWSAETGWGPRRLQLGSDGCPGGATAEWPSGPWERDRAWARPAGQFAIARL